MTQSLLPGSVLALPDQAVQRLIKLDNGDAALLYLHLLRRNGLEGLPWPVERKQAALEALQSQGLAPRELSSAPAAPIPEPAPPEYALEAVSYTHLDVYKRQGHSAQQPQQRSDRCSS